MKTTNILALALFLLVFFTSCEKDGSLIQILGLGSSELVSSESEVVLTKETSASQVLAFTWDESILAASDESVNLPSSVPVIKLEASVSSSFDTIIEYTASGTTYSFTGTVLNKLGKDLGLTSGVSKSLYFRLNVALGDNTEPKYSNTVVVSVTCYTLNMSVGYILNSDKEDTGFTLYSPDSDGEYYGFTGSGAWYNWYLLEGDGTIWGNYGADGYPFVISNESSFWNFWYPGQSGCYYTTLSTSDKKWTASYIPSLSVSGDITGTMTFDKAAVKWYISITSTVANSKIKVSCSSVSLYNSTTGTTDASAVSKTLGFIPNTDSTLSIAWNSESAGTITIPQAGDYTLTFYLSNPQSWTFSVSSGKTIVLEPLSEKLYLPGIDDGTSGSWNFNNYLTLVSEDDSTFAGVVNVNSKWGYEMTLDSGEWTNVYQMGSTTGTLGFKSGTNITAPTAGLYLIQADLKNLTYSHTAVTGLSYAGLNDSWGTTSLTASSVSGVYTGSVTISTVSSYGCQLLVSDSWTNYYGGSDGVLAFKGTNIKDDATVGAGSYDLVVNLCSNTYVFLGSSIYLAGLNDDWSEGSSMTLSKSSVGVYSGTVTLTKSSTYGMTIQLDKTWARYYGGSFSSLVYKGSNIKDDQSLAAGTYLVTVDFVNNMCSFTAQ